MYINAFVWRDLRDSGRVFFVVLFLHFHIGVLHRVRRGFQCLENGLLHAEKCSWAFC